MHKKEENDAEIKKGYYDTEKDIVAILKEKLSRGNKPPVFKTVEMQIMDIADDIAYSVYDLEDSLKGGFITGLDLLTDYDSVFRKVSESVNKKLERKDITPDIVRRITKSIFSEFVGKIDFSKVTIGEIIFDDEVQTLISSYAYTTSRSQAKNGFYRSQFTSFLVGAFIRAVDIDLYEPCPPFSKVSFNKGSRLPKGEEIELTIEVLKRFTYEFQIQSHKLKIVESRGRDIVHTIFKKLLKSKGEFMPEDYRHIYNRVSNISDGHKRELAQYRIICDFVASMTDQYAVEFYGRLKSENPQSIFKSI